MKFLPELIRTLKENGRIYTVRRYRYSFGSYVPVDGVGICRRTYIGQVSNKKDLEPYVERSGFTTTDSWWKKIRELNKNYVGPFYLYEITEEDENETT